MFLKKVRYMNITLKNMRKTSKSTLEKIESTKSNADNINEFKVSLFSNNGENIDIEKMPNDDERSDP
jgi:hypothetical protein